MGILLVSFLAIPVHLGKYPDAAVPKVISHICRQHLKMDGKVPNDSSDDRSNRNHAAKVGAPVQLHSFIVSNVSRTLAKTCNPFPSQARFDGAPTRPTLVDDMTDATFCGERSPQ